MTVSLYIIKRLHVKSLHFQVQLHVHVCWLHEVGDEFNLIFLCPIFNYDRERYLDRRIRRPIMQHIVNLINSNNILKLKKNKYILWKNDATLHVRFMSM